MPITKLCCFAPLVLLALAGCGALLSAPPPAAVRVAGGALVIAGPAGYCVDQRLSRDGPGEGFVMLGSCAALSRGALAGPIGLPALLTATVSGEPLAAPLSLAEMERFLRSPAGRAALSRTNQAQSVSIREIRRERGVLYLVVTDTAPPQPDTRVGQTYWRAVFALNGRLVSATVLSFTDRPLGRDAGLGLLARFVNRLRTVNPPAS